MSEERFEFNVRVTEPLPIGAPIYGLTTSFKSTEKSYSRKPSSTHSIEELAREIVRELKPSQGKSIPYIIISDPKQFEGELEGLRGTSDNYRTSDFYRPLTDQEYRTLGGLVLQEISFDLPV